MTPAKRLFDLGSAVVGTMLALPVFAVVAVLVAHDGGPVFYRQQRVGRNGRPFRMWKFRTMTVNADQIGPMLTVTNDARITAVGHWLRRSKLDELPQLLNVLRGDMSLVGPRPEVPHYVAMYDSAMREVLSLTPGITDPASLHYVDESQVLAQASDPERYYVTVLMPDKIRRNLEYAARATLATDLGLVYRTLRAALGRARD